jgi:signal recognition particle GTPase
MVAIIDALSEPPENRKNLILSGLGGTGKTSTLCDLAVALGAADYKVYLTTVSGKATGVLRNKVTKRIRELGKKSLPIKINTLQKITKKSAVLGYSDSGETLYSNSWLDPKDFDGDIVLVDEVSMCGQLYCKWMALTKALIVYIGDTA